MRHHLQLRCEVCWNDYDVRFVGTDKPPPFICDACVAVPFGGRSFGEVSVGAVTNTPASPTEERDVR